MKEIYITPSFAVIVFNTTNILTASDGNELPDQDIED